MRARFKHRQRKGYNYHHIKPKSIGGQSVGSNMLFLKMNKHNAIHRIFGNASPKQILKMLKNFEEDFKIIFGDVSFEEASKIFERMLRIKKWGG